MTVRQTAADLLVFLVTMTLLGLTSCSKSDADWAETWGWK